MMMKIVIAIIVEKKMRMTRMKMSRIMKVNWMIQKENEGKGLKKELELKCQQEGKRSLKLTIL